MSRELVMLLGGRRAGLLSQEGGVLRLNYTAMYQDARTAVPLSLSLPLSDLTHAGAVVRAFCQGLLPDNEAVLERWGRDFQVSAGNPFALLTHVGEDCAGADSVVALGSDLPERLVGQVTLHVRGCVAALGRT